jgi:hypothetical protein
MWVEPPELSPTITTQRCGKFGHFVNSLLTQYKI